MYVSGFGGSWFDHPFWRVKFVLRTPEQLARVRHSDVPYVEIDDELGAGLVTRPAPDDVDRSSKAPVSKSMRSSGGGREPRSARISATPNASERQRARALVSRSLKVVKTACEDVRLGRAVRLDDVNTVVHDVIDTVERSPRALLEVLRLKRKDEYTYLHSVAVCTLMINAAVHLGKGAAETREYGLGGLLHDLGKMGTPDEILNKKGRLTDGEFAAVQGHPEFGYQVLAQSEGMPQVALDVCRHHHEKIDGSGYPFGLTGDAISEVARLGAVCDVYDALTSERAYKSALPPLEALTEMWSWEGHFDRDLLFKFMQSVGFFPPGMLVRLRSNLLAFVREAKGRQQGARVLAFYATRENRPVAPQEILIQEDLANDSIVAFSNLAAWQPADLQPAIDLLTPEELEAVTRLNG
jgi:putative nucleotidyltransferase with HDIG domain